MKLNINSQISIVTNLQTKLLGELDSDVLDRSLIEFLGQMIKTSVESLDVLACLPEEDPESLLDEDDV